MSSRGPLALTLAVLVCALPASGCLGDGGADAGRAPVKGNRLVIYSSLPRTGPMAGATEAVAAGQRQALADARGRAGRYRVRLVELPATTVDTDPGDPWDPGQVSENAGRAAADPRTIAYLGELGLGASAVSVPITNEAGILQVSPGDGLTGLTRRLGRTTARPERYYPSGRRTFVRLVPDDLAQAQRVVRRMVALGGDRAALVAGPGVYAREFADDLTAEARRAGLEPVEAIDLREGPGPVAEATRELVELAPDSVLVAAARSRSLAALLAGLQRRMPQARLFGGGGVLVGDPISSGGDPLPPLEAVAARAPTSRPAVRALARIRAGQGLRTVRPEALWGYESVRLVLDSIRRAQRGSGPARRGDVVREALSGRLRRSPLGAYSVRPTGAVEGLGLALYRLEGNRFAPVRRMP